MQKYVLLARVSNEFASAMLNKPQDRLEIVRPILNALNIEVCEFLFTSDSNFNFVGILKANSDDDVEALKNIVDQSFEDLYGPSISFDPEANPYICDFTDSLRSWQDVGITPRICCDVAKQ